MLFRSDTFSTTLSTLTPNVRAAWRRRGVRYSSCGTQTYMFPLHFPRRYTPACAKPPVVRSVIFRECCRCLFRCRIVLNFRAVLLFQKVVFVRYAFGLHLIFNRLSLSNSFSGYSTVFNRLSLITDFSDCICFGSRIVSRFCLILKLLNSLCSRQIFRHFTAPPRSVTFGLSGQSRQNYDNFWILSTIHVIFFYNKRLK